METINQILFLPAAALAVLGVLIVMMLLLAASLLWQIITQMPVVLESDLREFKRWRARRKAIRTARRSIRLAARETQGRHGR